MRLVDADKARECFSGDRVTGAVMRRIFDSLPYHRRRACGQVPGVQAL